MPNTPFRQFGSKLKQIRTSAQESLADVSGAVETDISFLKQVEDGVFRPSEDLVLLLINHFSLKDDDALQLWELAGYAQDKDSDGNVIGESDIDGTKAYVAVGDVRILYTDIVHIRANKHGVVINFLQSLGDESRTMAVSRVGMSREHALSLLDLLKQTLEPQKSEPPKQLKAQDDSANSKQVL